MNVYESGPVQFSMELDRLDRRPYRTEVQFYKSLLALKRGIDRELLAECVSMRMSRKIYKIRDIIHP